MRQRRRWWCEWCGNDLPKHSRARTCCPECKRDLREDEMRRRGQVFPCLGCGREILGLASAERKYCSKECRGADQTKREAIRLNSILRMLPDSSYVEIAQTLRIGESTVQKVVAEYRRLEARST